MASSTSQPPDVKTDPVPQPSTVLVEYIEPGTVAEAMLAQVEHPLCGDELLIRDVPLGNGVGECRPGSMSDTKIQSGEKRVSIRVGAVLRVILAGWSPVAEFCASFSMYPSYEVILWDARPEVIAKVNLPGMQVFELLLARFITEQGAHRATAVRALTHDPLMGYLTLIEGLLYPRHGFAAHQR